MKKLLTVLVIFLTLIVLMGCTQEEDYYTKDEVSVIISEVRESIQADLDALQPTREERYLNSVLMTMLLDGVTHFVEVGDRVTGSVEDWSYGYIVIELDTAVTVDIKLIVVAPDDSWDLNVYFGGALSDADLTFENIENGDVYRVTLQAGFNTIEIDSYSDVEYLYTIEIIAVT